MRTPVFNGLASEKVTESSQPARNMGSRYRQYLAVSVGNMAALVFGAALGWSSPMLPLLQSARSPLGAPLSEASASWLSSLLFVGALLATPALAYLSARHSRKMLGYMTGASGAAGWLLTATAWSETALLIARLLLGFVASGSCIFCMLYVVEIVDDDIRGSMGSLINLFVCGGVLFSYSVGSYATYLTFNLLCFAFAIFFLAALWQMPESPVYLDSIGQHVAATQARQWLRLKENDSAKSVIVAENSKDASFQRPRISQLLSSKGTRKAIVISLGLVLNNQLSGITAVISYTVTIFQASGNELSPNISAIMVGALQLCAVYLTSLLIDQMGRKTLLLISNITITICLTLLGVFFYLKNSGSDTSSVEWLPIASLCLFVVGFAMGSGTIVLIIIGEVFPPHIKGVAVTSSICFLNFMAFVIARFFTTLVQILGMCGCFWFFAGFCFIFVFFGYFVIPETKNKSIESILAELNGGTTSKMNLEKPCMV